MDGTAEVLVAESGTAVEIVSAGLQLVWYKMQRKNIGKRRQLDRC